MIGPPIGYSGKPLAQKIEMKPGDRISAIDAPDHTTKSSWRPCRRAGVVAAKAGRGEAGAVLHAFVWHRAGRAAPAPVLAPGR